MADSGEIIEDADLLQRLAELLGEDGLITGEAAAPWFTDVYRRRESPLGVVRPADVATLQAVVEATTSRGVAIFPRGGGASYSDGYLPSRPRAIVVDLGRLDRIVEINETDAYVTVEAGVTWARLKAALDPLGLRTPFFGPFSGLAASVGGSVSQHSLSHGSGAHGISAQSILSLDVVTASGELIQTGSAARGAAPFARFYGPDLTGLFTGDCGALGVKARITLPLLRRKAASGCASYAFETFADLAEAMRRSALEGLDDEHFAIDAALAQGQIARQDAGAIFDMAKQIMAGSSSVFAGAGRLLSLALSGARGVAGGAYMLHLIVEGVSPSEVAPKLRRLRRLMRPGREIANAVPTIVREFPFAPLHNILGPEGERWVPLHGVLAHSKVAPFHEALLALYAERALEIEKRGVWTGGMFETVGSTGFLYEVALYWHGPPTAYHRATLSAEHLAGLPKYPHDAATAEFVETLKTDITTLLGHFGAVHFQLGKTYPYASVLACTTLALVKAIKAAVDPQGLMNPGALGL